MMVVGKVLSSVTIPQNGAIVHTHDKGHNLREAPEARGPPLPTPVESQRKVQLLEASFENLARISALHPRSFFVLFVYLVVTGHAGEMIP